MKFKRDDLWTRLGLSYQSYATKFDRDHILSHQTRHTKFHLLAGLMVRIHHDPTTSREVFHLEYQRMLPDGQARNQSLIRIETGLDQDGNSLIKDIRVQSKSVPRSDDAMNYRRTLNRVFQAFATQTQLVRHKGDISQSLKFLYQDHLSDVIGGEEIVMRGLDRTGGFSKSSGSYFALASAQQRNSVVITTDHPDKLLNLLGFSRNTFEEEQDYAGGRSLYGTSSEPGITYRAASFVKRPSDDIIDIHLSAVPDDIMSPDTLASLPDLARVSFQRISDQEWMITQASFMGGSIPTHDVRKIIDILGFIQGSNQSFGQWAYPPFMDLVTECDLNNDIDMFPPPPDNNPFGQWLYGSLHGTGLEKVIDDFGDQIGIASIFLRRISQNDGTVKTIGVAVDLPFAAGGPDSTSDGAVADHSRFLPFIDHILITHDHFDHCGGAAKLAAAGLLVGKTIVCSEIVKRKIVSEMNNLEIAKNLRPLFQKPEAILALHDDSGNRVMMVQSCQNATVHSSYTTPYIITPCYNDDWYGPPAVVYGDATGFTQRGKDFFQEGTKALSQYPGVTPEKVDIPLGLTLHDITSWRNEGHAPSEDAFKETLSFILECEQDRAAIIAKFSTNQREDKAILDILQATGRKTVTAVGANQQERMTTMNSAGVLPEVDLKDVDIPLSKTTDRVRELYDQYCTHISSFAPDSNGDDLLKNTQRLQKRLLKQLKETIQDDGIDPVRSTEVYALRRLMASGKIDFAHNDVNAYLMYVAFIDQTAEASVHFGRNSGSAKGARSMPGELAVLVTGPIGTMDQQFATLPKTVSMTSLLDVDMDVRNSGFTIPAEARASIIVQPPPIHDNEAAQNELISGLIEKRGQTVYAAHRDGFKIYNARDKFQDIVEKLRSKGWSYRVEADPRSYAPQYGCEGTIVVTGRSLHIHGHGFREDGKENVGYIPSILHMAHHIPNMGTYDLFRQDVKAMGRNAPDIDKPQDFVFYDVRHGASAQDVEMNEFARINPSYITFNLYRAYGRFFRGFMELTRKTLLRNEGHVHSDPLRARTTHEGLYESSLIARDWSSMVNPQFPTSSRGQQIRPSDANILSEPEAPRSRPAHSIHPSLAPYYLNRNAA